MLTRRERLALVWVYCCAGETPAVIEQKKEKTPAVFDMILTDLESIMPKSRNVLTV